MTVQLIVVSEENFRLNFDMLSQTVKSIPAEGDGATAIIVTPGATDASEEVQAAPQPQPTPAPAPKGPYSPAPPDIQMSVVAQLPPELGPLDLQAAVRHSGPISFHHLAQILATGQTILILGSEDGR